MSVGWPAGLFGLAALLLPVIIHLLQRGAGRQLQVASIRFFTDDEQPSWRRLQLTEYGLLALRLLLFALLVALLARVTLDRISRGPSSSVDRAWVLPGVDPAFAATVAQPDAALRWLAPGFAPVSDATGERGQSEWSLLLFLSRRAPGSAPVVIGPARPATLGPRRPGFHTPPTWIEAPAAEGEASPATAPDVTLIAAGRDASLVTAVRDAIAAWRRTGFAFGEVREIDPQRARSQALRAEDWVIAVGDAATGLPVAVDVTVRVDGNGSIAVAGPGAVDRGDAGQGFAARLFFALSGEFAAPPIGYHIDPALALPDAGTRSAGWRARPAEVDGAGAVTWLSLALAALWTIERAYSGVLQGRGS